MKKRIITLFILSALIISAGCVPNYQDDENSSDNNENSNYIIVEPQEEKSYGDTLIERKEVSGLPVPEGGISVEQAADILYSCNQKDLNLPESANTYKAVCIGIVDYNNKDYYSFYLNYDTGKEKITVGTHYLVSTNGKTVRRKLLTGQHYVVKKNTADSDQTPAERFPGSKITPNEALKILAEKKDSLKLKKPFSDYIFEMKEKTYEINGVNCYYFIPKLEYTDHMNLSSGFFVSVDGKLAYYAITDSNDTYTEIK